MIKDNITILLENFFKNRNRHYSRFLDDLHNFDANAYDQLSEIMDSISISAEVDGVKLSALKRQIKSSCGVWFDELISSMNDCLKDGYEVADYYGLLCNNNFKNCAQLKQDALTLLDDELVKVDKLFSISEAKDLLNEICNRVFGVDADSFTESNLTLKGKVTIDSQINLYMHYYIKTNMIRVAIMQMPDDVVFLKDYKDGYSKIDQVVNDIIRHI